MGRFLLPGPASRASCKPAALPAPSAVPRCNLWESTQRPRSQASRPVSFGTARAARFATHRLGRARFLSRIWSRVGKARGPDNGLSGPLALCSAAGLSLRPLRYEHPNRRLTPLPRSPPSPLFSEHIAVGASSVATRSSRLAASWSRVWSRVSMPQDRAHARPRLPSCRSTRAATRPGGHLSRSCLLCA